MSSLILPARTEARRATHPGIQLGCRAWVPRHWPWIPGLAAAALQEPRVILEADAVLGVG